MPSTYTAESTAETVRSGYLDPAVRHRYPHGPHSMPGPVEVTGARRTP